MTRGPAAEAGVEAAKIAFHKGSVMLGKRSFQEAETFFREATLTHPSVARYWQALGWAIFNHVEGRTEEQRLEDARKAYEKALELDEEDAQTHYNIGLYWKAKDDMKRTKRAMELAVEHKPNFIEAKRELRLMEMRHGKGRERKASSSNAAIPLDDPGKGKGKGKRKAKPPTGFFGKLKEALTKKR
jgi:Flp pilus assembly protein TadD